MADHGHSEQAQQNLIKVIASHSYAKVVFLLPLHGRCRATKNSTLLLVHHDSTNDCHGLANSLRSAGDQISPDNHTNMENQFLVTIASGNYKFDVNLGHIAKYSALFDLIRNYWLEELEILYNKQPA